MKMTWLLWYILSSDKSTFHKDGTYNHAIAESWSPLNGYKYAFLYKSLNEEISIDKFRVFSSKERKESL